MVAMATSFITFIFMWACLCFTFLTFCKKAYRILKKKLPNSTKVRFFTHFLTHIRIVVQVDFLIPNDQLCLRYGSYLPSRGAPGGCHVLKSGRSTIINTILSFRLLILTIWERHSTEEVKVKH